ncbi:MAG: ABC transporter permease [Clostridiales bacterium]|nr:ABC transporter permease [Clostridiales bacterium]
MPTTQQPTGPAKEKHHNQVAFAAILLAGIIVLSVLFNFIAGGKFLEPSNIKLIISYTVWPTFVSWGLCFLFACGYTDLSVGSILVLGSFATTIFGNWLGYPGVILGGVLTGTLAVFINFNVFAFTNIPSWIAGISLAMIYEAIAIFLKVNKTTSNLIYTDMPDGLRHLGNLPWSLILAVIGFVAVYLLYNRTSVGLNIRALGGNIDVAKALGINVLRTLLMVGIISGIFIGFASVVQQSFAGRTTIATGLTSIYVIFRPLAIVLLAQILQKRLNIIIAVPICAVIIFAVFNLLTLLGIPSGTLQEALLGGFLIVFGILGQRGYKGVIK